MPEPYMNTASGRKIDIPDPRPGQIVIEDAAIHLSRIPRFVGATTRTYSVAQHSIVVAYLACAIAKHENLQVQGTAGNAASLFREGLAHDLHEFLMNDTPSPIKHLLGPQYRRIEQSIDRAIRREFGLLNSMPDVVRTADHIALLLEADELCRGNLDMQYVPDRVRTLITHMDNEWYAGAQTVLELSWNSDDAYTQFMAEWNTQADW